MPSQRISHDTTPPASWSQSVCFLTKPRLSPSLPPQLMPLITQPSSTKYQPRTVAHPPHIIIRPISIPSHPAYGQYGLFSKKKIGPNELIIPYLGVLHASFIPTEGDSLPTGLGLPGGQGGSDEHAESDYDLSLLRISASDPRNPFPGHHISIGVDAASAGNAARFINDYRGVGPTAPNAEFRVGYGESGEMRMEVWSLKCGLGKGDEILVSYGKGWWSARNPG